MLNARAITQRPHLPDRSPSARSAPRRDRKAFVDLPFRLNADDPNWVPPLKGEALGLITPEKNGWFSHAEAQLFLAERGGQRRRAHLRAYRHARADDAAEQGFGPGTG